MEIIEQAEKAIKQEGRSLSQFIVDEMKDYVMKKAEVNSNNPISINYQQVQNCEPLDKYLDEGRVKAHQWKAFFEKVDEKDRLRKISALCKTIANEAEGRLHFLETGRMKAH
jgi:hypothetical protein